MIRNNRLEIFENFQIDRKLLKYRDTVNLNNGIAMEGGSTSNWVFASAEGDDAKVTLNNSSFVIEKLSKIFKGKKKKKKHKKKIVVKTVGDFFKNLFDSVEELKRVDDVIEHYDKIIENAIKTGQQALIERVKEKINLISLESKLITSNFTKYVTEEQILTFLNIEDARLKGKSEIQKKYIHLSWIKNYNRLIPNEVVDVKKEADSLKVFDNYVVLYYSPDGKHESLTKEEIKKAADPILFGVIENSNKLYYIGDWIDEYCDLTLDKLLNRIDEKSFEITNESVKTAIK